MKVESLSCPQTNIYHTVLQSYTCIVTNEVTNFDLCIVLCKSLTLSVFNHNQKQYHDKHTRLVTGIQQNQTKW